MAERKKPQTEPVLDNSAANKDRNLEKSKVVHALDTRAFNSIIRQVKTIDPDGAQAIVNTTKNRLKELGIERDLSDEVPGDPPEGSDQFDPGSFMTWVAKIQTTDEVSIKQLVAIDATAQTRFPDQE